MAFGKLAKEFCNVQLEIQVLRSGAGFYIGTIDEEGPCSHESEEYWDSRERAELALRTGQWTQKDRP